MGNSNSNHEEPFLLDDLKATIQTVKRYVRYFLREHDDYPQEDFTEPSCQVNTILPISETPSSFKVQVKNFNIPEEDVPDGFICPITHEIFFEPVILVETGHTFEKEALDSWLSMHDTCPMTRSKLVNKSYIPVYSLKSAIASWKESKRRSMYIQ